MIMKKKAAAFYRRGYQAVALFLAISPSASNISLVESKGAENDICFGKIRQNI